LKKSEKWYMCGQIIEVTDELNYIGIRLENTEGWNKQKEFKAKGHQALIVIYKCLTRTSNIKVQKLENIVYEILCEFRIMYGVGLWDCMKHGRKLTKFTVDSAKNC
jgi:hypothetical protein